MATRLFPPVMTASPILDVLDDAVALAERLLQVLEQESAALDAMKLEAPGTLIETKNRLIAAYAVRLEEIQEAPRPLPPETADKIAILKELNGRVLKVAETNGIALQAAMEANKQVVEIVLRTAGDQQRRESGVGYGRVGSGAKLTQRTAVPKGALLATRL